MAGRRPFGTLGAIAVSVSVAFVAYGPTLGSYFVSEDLQCAATWTFSHAVVELTSAGLEQGFRPLMVVFWAAGNALFGRDPVGHRVIYVLLHGLNGCLVLWLAVRLGSDRLAAGCAALLFLLYPVHAETLGWLAAASNTVTSAFFIFSSVLLHLECLEEPAPRRRAVLGSLALLAFVLGLGVKEYAVVVPVVLAALHVERQLSARGHGPRPWTSMARRVGPFWLALGAYVVYRGVVMRGVGNYGTEGFLGWKGSYLATVATQGRALSLPWSGWTPFSLAFDVLHLVPWLPVAAAAVAVPLAGRLRWAILWIVVLLLPTLNRTGHHHLYIPSAGAAVLLGEVIAAGVRRLAVRVGSSVACAAAMPILAVYLGSTWRASGAWIEAGRVTRSVPEQVRRLRPSLPPGAYLFFFGLPDNVRGAYAFRWGIQPAIRLEYGDRSLRAYNVRDVKRSPAESTLRILSTTQSAPRFFFRYEAGTVREMAPVEIAELQAEEVLVEQPRAEWPVGEIRGPHVHGQTFRVEADAISRIDLRFDQYQRPNHHPVTFRLKRSPAAPEDLATVELSPWDLLPGDWCPIRFPTVAVPEDGVLSFQLESPASHRGDAVTVLAAAEAYPEGASYTDGRPQARDLAFRVVGRRRAGSETRGR